MVVWDDIAILNLALMKLRILSECVGKEAELVSF